MGKNGNVRHHRMLHKSSPNDIALIPAVHDRYIELCGLYYRVNEEKLVPPPDLDADMLQWRQLVARYKLGDYRHTDAELKSLRTIAQWTLDLKCDLCGQPRKKLQW